MHVKWYLRKISLYLEGWLLCWDKFCVVRFSSQVFSFCCYYLWIFFLGCMSPCCYYIVPLIFVPLIFSIVLDSTSNTRTLWYEDTHYTSNISFKYFVPLLNLWLKTSCVLALCNSFFSNKTSPSRPSHAWTFSFSC